MNFARPLMLRIICLSTKLQGSLALRINHLESKWQGPLHGPNIGPLGHGKDQLPILVQELLLDSRGYPRQRSQQAVTLRFHAYQMCF